MKKKAKPCKSDEVRRLLRHGSFFSTREIAELAGVDPSHVYCVKLQMQVNPEKWPARKDQAR